MNYKGYRIAFVDQGDIIPLDNMLIARGTYKFFKDDRVVDSYVDANKVTHEVIAEQKKVIITFTLKEHDLAEHEDIEILFRKRENVQIKYYDDDFSGYFEGTFKIYPIEWSHRNTIGNDIRYNAAQVKIEEY